MKTREQGMGNDARIAVLETTINHIDGSLVGISQELRRLSERLDVKLDSMDNKFDKKLDALNDRIWSNFLWMIGGFASILGIVAHALHWV